MCSADDWDACTLKSLGRTASLCQMPVYFIYLFFVCKKEVEKQRKCGLINFLAACIDSLAIGASLTLESIADV